MRKRAEHPLDLDIHYAADSRATFGLRDSVTVGTATAKRDGPDMPPTFEYIKQEMAKGQDVELSLNWFGIDNNGRIVPRGGHVIAVSGVLSGPNGDSIYVNDDPPQDGTGKGRETKWLPVGKVKSGADTWTTLARLNGNIVNAVYSESPKPTAVAVVPDENKDNVAVHKAEPPAYTTPGRSAATTREVIGTPTAVPGSPFAAGSRAVAAATALGKFAYIANFGSNNVSAFRIDPVTAALTAIPGSPFVAGGSPFDAVVDPTGRLLYVANYASANISAYTIDPITGALTAVPGSPFASGVNPAGVAVSPSGRLLFCSASGGGVRVYTIDVPTGVLTPVAGSPFAAGTNPYSVKVEASGRFVYVANASFNQGNGTVSAFSIGATGALTPVTGSPFAAGSQPVHISIDMTGRFLYTANVGSSNLSAFSIDSTTGALAAIAGSPYAVPTGPFGVAVEPGGQYLYAATQGTNPGFIAAFSIDANNGTLAALPGSPFPGGTAPARLAFASIPPNTGIANPAPAVAQLAPSGAKPGAPVTVVSVMGNNFVSGSIVRWNGAARYSVFISSTQLNVAILASDLAQAGTANVTVTNPAPGGGTSSGLAFTINASVALPSVGGDATLNNAGFTTGRAVAPGSIAASFGVALASGITPLTSPPQNELIGSSLRIDGLAAPLYFASSGQIVFQVPWELAGKQRAFGTFTSGAGTGSPTTISVAEYAPGIFTMNAAGQGAILINSTGELAAPAGTIPGFGSRAAPRGDYIAIYCTGLGDVTNRPATGAPASLDPNSLSYTLATPAITIGGVPATTVFSGLAPGFVGLYQVVVKLDDATPVGDAVPLVMTIAGQRSNTVIVAVQ